MKRPFKEVPIAIGSTKAYENPGDEQYSADAGSSTLPFKRHYFQVKKIIFFLLFFIGCNNIANAQVIAGIGAQLILDTTGGYTMPRIFSLVPRSPAYAALNATDYIIKVNDVPCKNKTIEDVVALIRGVEGTPVKITTAHTKDGINAKDTSLIRVSIQIGNQPDPVAAFNEACETEANQLKKSGSEIIKTFNSDCGNYFFNFNADAGVYHIRMYTLDSREKPTDKSAFSATEKVFDGDNEAGAIELTKQEPKAGNPIVAQLEGTITFKRSCVGVVGITINDDVKKCRALFITVYK